MIDQRPTVEHQAVRHQRWELLRHLNALTDKPMILLAFVWLGLLILDFTQGLSPFLHLLSYGIWGLFILDFVIELLIAPHKGAYLRHHWLIVLALLLPAFRVLAVFQALRLFPLALTTHWVGLLRVLTSLNRSMGALRRTLDRHGVGYISALTLAVVFGGAAGMVHFESPTAWAQAGLTPAVQAGAGLHSYGEAVWWTAMVMTTMGSEYWPKTAEGRLLTLLLALYAFAMFGYITATIAGHFVATETAAEPVSGAEVAALREELSQLRAELAVLMTRLEG